MEFPVKLIVSFAGVSRTKTEVKSVLLFALTWTTALPAPFTTFPITCASLKVKVPLVELYVSNKLFKFFADKSTLWFEISCIDAPEPFEGVVIPPKSWSLGVPVAITFKIELAPSEIAIVLSSKSVAFNVSVWFAATPIVPKFKSLTVDKSSVAPLKFNVLVPVPPSRVLIFVTSETLNLSSPEPAIIFSIFERVSVLELPATIALVLPLFTVTVNDVVPV